MAPKRKATKTAVAVKTDTEPTAVNSHAATEQIIETKKPNKRDASKKNAIPEIEATNNDDIDISPKKVKTRTKRENVKKVASYFEQSVDEKMEPAKKKSRGKKAPAELVEADDNSENDKHVANNSTKADGNAKKSTKKNAVSDEMPAVDKKTAEEKPKKAKITKLKKEENEPAEEVTAPKRKTRVKTEKTESANDENKPVPKGRKRTADKPDEVVVDTKMSKKVIKKTIAASPEKRPVKSRTAVKKEEKTDVEVKSSPANKKKVVEAVETAVKKRIKTTARISTGGKKPRKQLKSRRDLDSPDDDIDISLSDKEYEESKEEPYVSTGTPHKPKNKRYLEPEMGGSRMNDRYKKMFKNEKPIAQDNKPKQKMNSSTTDHIEINPDTMKVKQSKETSNDDTIDTSQNFSSDDEHDASEEETVVKKGQKATVKLSKRGKNHSPKMGTRHAAVTKRNKKEKIIALDEIKSKQKMNSTTTDYTKINFESDKEHNLKICSWNVAGLRALIAKSCFGIYIEHEKPDIICLQEIKCLEEEVPAEAKIPGYHMYWCSKPGGRGGVALLSKKMPYNIDKNIGDDEMDEEGRIITAEYNTFYLVCVYVPNAGRKLVNLERRLRWNKMFDEHVDKLKATKPVVIVGDMNVAHTEIDLANPKTNTKNAGFSPEERMGMTDLLSHGFIDTFRHLYPERKNAYTFWSYMGGARAKNVGWRLDYAIVDDRLASKVVDNIIRSPILGSDHCPIVLLLNM